MSPHAKHAEALRVASQARLTLAGKVKHGGFWAMPSGRPFVVACWKQNMERAARIRKELTA